MKLISTNIGKRKTIVWQGQNVETGIYKIPVKGEIFLGDTDVRLDEVIDRRHHGGIEKAVYAYSIKHYEFFKELYPNLEWDYGMFGENLTFSDLDEEEITVGSVYQLGQCLLEVTQPRQPCYKLGVRFGDQQVVRQFWNSTKSGVYFKVLQTGTVKNGDVLILKKRMTTTPTISDVFKGKRKLN